MILYPLNRGQAISPTFWIPASEDCFSIVASFKVYSLSKKPPGLGVTPPRKPLKVSPEGSSFYIENMFSSSR